MTNKLDELERRIATLEEADTVPLDRVAALVERLEQGQVPSAETQAAAWAQVLNALSIALHAGVHSVKGEAECGNADCALREVEV